MEQEGRNVVTFTVCLVLCLLKNMKGCLLFWVASGHGQQYWKNIITSLITVDYCQWKCLKWCDFGPWAQEWGSPGAMTGCCSFCFAQCWHQWDTGGQVFPTGRVGMHYFDSDPSLLLKWQNVQFLLECILQPSMAGSIHSHPVLIMCQTIMSQSLASHVRKLAPPPLLCYSMQIEKG